MCYGKCESTVLATFSLWKLAHDIQRPLPVRIPNLRYPTGQPFPDGVAIILQRAESASTDEAHCRLPVWENLSYMNGGVNLPNW